MADPMAGGASHDLDIDWDNFDFGQMFKPGLHPDQRLEADGRDKYKLLLEISKALSSNLVLDELLVEILDTVIRVTRMHKGLLALLDDDGRFRMRMARNFERKSLREEEFESPRSVMREVRRTGRPVSTAPIEKQQIDAGAAGQPAVVSFPLKASRSDRADRRWGTTDAQRAHTEGSRQRIIGLIYMESPLTDAVFPGVDLEFIEALAAQAGIAIENAWLYERVNRDRLTLADENRDLRREVRGKYAFENMVGTGERMRALYDLVDRVSHSHVNVMIRGESGTGKELVAKTIHYNSERARGPFVSINCAALPENLLESELFGIEKGVATGVDKRVGKFEQAAGGTFFLDEIGDMSLAIQAKLLRVIEARELQRVGGKVTIPIDVRIVAATHRDLEAAIRANEFREDLYFRLNVVPVQLPPLRDRREDMPDLIEHFLAKHSEAHGRRIEGVTRAALDALVSYRWPGNVRELENVIQRALLMCDSNLVDVDDLPPELIERRGALIETALDQQWTVDRLVKEYAARVVMRNKGNLTRSARDLGIDFKTLKKKLDEHHERT